MRYPADQGEARPRRPAQDIETKWQERWAREKTFAAEEPLGPAVQGIAGDSSRKKFYVLEMFPYPSGQLHMGHLRVYCIGDALAHYYRMKGCNVVHPMGFDAFGLPAENAAIKNHMHPAKWTYANIDQARAQLKRMGISYDWDREVITCHEDYYRWTQWLFLKFYERGLVYKSTDLLNWCETCQTVLANEQVENGMCWRCGNAVGQRETEGWYFKITAYADQLVEDLKLLEGKWPDRIILMQRNWMGKSEGVQFNFPLSDRKDSLEVFTTRVDTVFGATYMVMAAEHPLSLEVSKTNQAVAKFVEDQRQVDRTIRTVVEQEKRGVFSGVYAMNPATEQKIPVWIANYVVMGYGTGAIMAVPAHDQRDYEFARKYGIEIRTVIQASEAPQDAAYEGEGIMVNSGKFDGLPSLEAWKKMAKWVEEQGWGKRQIHFRIRDWSISRQRFWGEPIPIVYCPTHGEVPWPLDQLPVRLPDTVEFHGASSPLPGMKAFVETSCPICGGPANRETQTMDAFVASSWYFARYIDPRNSRLPFDRAHGDYWLPVDIYVGGPEHACKHLIYARFFQKVMRDMGMTSASEPFTQLVTQGIVYKDGAKMSKSKGNIVSPDDMIKRYGADTGRLFILFAAPPEIDMEWNEGGVEGAHRFLNRIWRWMDLAKTWPARTPQFREEDRDFLHVIHTTIRRVSRDIEVERQFNTAISALMECLNAMQAVEPLLKASDEGKAILRWATETFVKLLAPFAPHLASEAWEVLGRNGLVVREEWPREDPQWLVLKSMEIPVQVNGRLRAVLIVPTEASEDLIKQKAIDDEKVKAFLEGKLIKKIIVVPKKMVNIVV